MKTTIKNQNGAFILLALMAIAAILIAAFAIYRAYKVRQEPAKRPKTSQAQAIIFT